MSRTRKIAGLSALGLTTAFFIATSFFLLKSVAPFSTFLLLITGIQSMVAFWALASALDKPGNQFYSVFVGDALLRMVGLGVAVYWLWSRSLPFTGMLLSLAIAYLLYSVIQIPFFYKAR